MRGPGYATTDHMLFSDDDEEGRNQFDVPPIPAEYRNNELPRSHVEVTERADGSVVWQGEYPFDSKGSKALTRYLLQ